MKDDKKKMMILGVLALVMIAVGAFSFMGGGGAAATTEVVATTETPTEGTDGDGTEAGVEGEEGAEGVEGVDSGLPTEGDGALALMPLPVRDPFTVPTGLDDRIQAAPPAPVQQTPAPVAQSSNPQPPAMHAGNAPLTPPMGGGLPSFGEGNDVSLPPVVAKPQYTVKGIILGTKPLAVFEDGDGNQKLVSVGGSVDGDTRVVAIDKGRVTVSYKGKQHTLVIEEEARND
jgi:hypothetical protein